MDKFVKYEDFGAVGDGIKDDFFAIKAAHDYANEHGVSVKGTPGKNYLIHDIVGEGDAASCISIQTDVDWTDVKFTVDDRGYYYKEKNNAGIFAVNSEYPRLVITDKDEISKIFPNLKIEQGFTGKINWSDYGYGALLVVKNADHKNYVRFGGNADSGQRQSELIVVDKDGKIREETPFMFAYDNITELWICRIDENPITIKGGEFHHIANDTPMVKEDWGYFSRSLSVKRSGTVIDGLKHLIFGELPGINVQGNTDPKGPPYAAFLSATCCTDVKFINCTLTARRVSGIAGTYDFGAGTANNLYLYNVNQSNYYEEDGKTPTMDYKHYWGIGGTNYCKNLTYDTCVMSRYDAHCGLYNGKIINSTVCNVELIGAGDMLIENTTFTPISFTPIMIRGDYGCTWRGTITVKDCTVKTPKGPITTFLNQGWSNHNFGYTCTAPDLLIDNLKWDTEQNNEVYLSSYSNKESVTENSLSDGTKNENKITPPKFIRVINNNDGTTYKLRAMPLFKNTLIEGVSLEEPESASL